MKIIILLLVMLISAYLLTQQLRSGTDSADKNSLPYQQPLNKARDVERLLQESVDERGDQLDGMLEQVQDKQ